MDSSKLLSIEPSSGEVGTTEASLLIARRLEALEAPRSLAELRLTEAEYGWLLKWASQLPDPVARQWIADRTTRLRDGELTRQQALGLLLFLVTAEMARREAAEGFVWSVVSKQFDLAGRALFTQGQPNYHFKSAFEAVARRFQLRNVFGLEGTQNWYVSTYLQFGFTSRGIDHLPYRLSGYPLTESIDQLLTSGANGAGAPIPLLVSDFLNSLLYRLVDWSRLLSCKPRS